MQFKDITLSVCRSKDQVPSVRPRASREKKSQLQRNGHQMDFILRNSRAVCLLLSADPRGGQTQREAIEVERTLLARFT